MVLDSQCRAHRRRAGSYFLRTPATVSGVTTPTNRPSRSTTGRHPELDLCSSVRTSEEVICSLTTCSDGSAISPALTLAMGTGNRSTLLPKWSRDRCPRLLQGTLPAQWSTHTHNHNGEHCANDRFEFREHSGMEPYCIREPAPMARDPLSEQGASGGDNQTRSREHHYSIHCGGALYSFDQRSFMMPDVVLNEVQQVQQATPGQPRETTDGNAQCPDPPRVPQVSFSRRFIRLSHVYRHLPSLV